MLDVTDLKLAVGTSGDAYEEELEGIAEAAMLDMENVGIARQDNDALYDHAVRMYVKGHFDTTSPDADDCRRIYDGLKGTMKMSNKYREAVV